MLSILVNDPISSLADRKPSFFSLSTENVKSLEESITQISLQYKRDWFNLNGGSTTRDSKGYEKPTFFNIALNYVPLNMDQLMKRAGNRVIPVSQTAKAPVPAAAPTPNPTQVQSVPEKKPSSKAKIEEVRPATPEPPAPSRAGLSSLLSGWWGRS
jgi:signal recognition particle subunit SRP68